MLLLSTETVKRLWSLCADKRLAAYTIGSALRAGLAVAVPFLLGVFIDNLVYGGNPLLYFLLLLFCAFAGWTFELLLRKMIIGIARSAEQDVQYRLLASFQTMKPASVDGYKNGEIAMKFYRDTGVFEQFTENFYPQFLNMLFGFFFALAAVLCKKPLIAVLYLFLLPVISCLFLFYTKALANSAHAIRSAYDKSINRIFEFMHIFPYLKSMTADEPYFLLPKSKFRAYRNINIINDKTVMGLEFSNRFLLLTGEYSVLGIAGWMAWEKMIPIGDVVMFQVLFLSVLNSFSGMFQLLPTWKTVQESIKSIYELLESSETENIERNPPIQTALSDISVRHLSFRYSANSPEVFKNFSCNIKAGTVVALTGINGSGKTTLLKLLTGYLLPNEGAIEIGGRKLSEWQIKSFRKKISYVFQDSLLITGTIRDNVTLKNTGYTKADIIQALRLSGADQLVARMPDGLDHKIGQDGGGLSGGERQKIAIARALIRNPDILIFDEVTNHLDYDSRIRIRDLMLSFRGKKTVIMVSHDPELVGLCDQEINLQQI